MRNLLLFGPFLWFRRVVLWVLILLLLLVLILYFIGNSSLAIKKAVEAFAPDYNISYDSIQGNALSGFEIKNPRYNNASIAKEMILKWNPNTLANKEITVSKLHLKEANIDVIKALAAQFGSDSNATQEQNSSSEPLGFTVEIEDIALSTQSFEIEGVSISSAVLKSNKVTYKDEALGIEALALDVESNVTDISVRGSYENQVVSLTDINLSDVNLTAILALTSADSNSTATEPNTKDDTQTAINSMMPKRVDVEHLEISMLPYSYDPIEITKIKLRANTLQYDVASKVLTQANLELNASSNLTELAYKGEIKENVLLGKLILEPKEALYIKYNIPLRKKAISKIEADLNVSTAAVIADITTDGKQILEAKEGAFNLDVDSFNSYVVYDINSSAVTADTKARVTTPYAKNIAVSNQLRFDDGLTHHGQINLVQVEGIDAKFVIPLENLKIDYNGTEHSIDTTFKSKQLQGYFTSADFKTAQAHIETDGFVALGTMVALPEQLADAKASVVIDAPLNLSDFSNIEAKVKLASNVVNLDADVTYAKGIAVDGQIVIPKDSLLKAYSQDVVWENLSPIDTKLRLKENKLSLALDAKALKTDINYDLDAGRVKGKINLAGLGVDIDGKVEDTIIIKTKVKSVKALGKKLNTLYAVGELPPLEGVIDASIRVKKLKSVDLSIVAPKLTYRPDKKTKHILKDVKLVASMNEDTVLLKSYNVVFNKQKYFSIKTAKIKLGDTMRISNFWINDSLYINGDYTSASKQGNFTAKAKRFHIKDKVADIYAKIDLDATLDGNDTRVEGKVVLLKGVITPQVEGRSFATDSDILFIQEMQKNKKSPFMDNLALMLKIETLKPLRVKQKGLRVKLKPDFTINKEKGGKILYLGSVDLLEGSSYIFQEKKFVLAKSAVYFTGDVNKPLLDIKAKYQSLNHLITIAVTGTPAEPNINFSSSPSLTREQILSVILFDSEAGGDTHSGSEMMRMMGGAMAKAALSDVGVKVDHLAFGEGNSIEVGKKLSSKTTVIYINGEIPKVKLKYQHNKRTESVIGVSEESQSYDIIYKRDF